MQCDVINKQQLQLRQDDNSRTPDGTRFPGCKGRTATSHPMRAHVNINYMPPGRRYIYSRLRNVHEKHLDGELKNCPQASYGMQP